MFLIKKNIRSRKGNVMAEAAIVIPLLMGIIFFIVEFGNVLYISNTLNQVARTGARYASITAGYTQSGVESAAGGSTLLSMADTLLTTTITPSPGTAIAIGDSILVMVSYMYIPTINPFSLIDATTSWSPVLKSTAVIRSEVLYAP